MGATFKERDGREGSLLLRGVREGREERWDGKGGELNSAKVNVSRIKTSYNEVLCNFAEWLLYGRKEIYARDC